MMEADLKTLVLATSAEAFFLIVEEDDNEMTTKHYIKIECFVGFTVVIAAVFGKSMWLSSIQQQIDPTLLFLKS